jgi:hypothetical protein
MMAILFGGETIWVVKFIAAVENRSPRDCRATTC